MLIAAAAEGRRSALPLLNLVSANESFRKAMCLLDAGDVVRAEQLLREVIGFREPNGEVLYYQACCCLGELLFELGRHDEAVPLLKQVATLDAAESI